MKKNILVPTDFSEASLSLVEHAIANTENDELHFVLTYCMFLPDSPIDQLFFSKIELFQSLKSPEFKRMCRAIRDRNSNRKIVLITELFTGLNQAAFNNFIDGNEIDEAVIPSRYQPRLNLKRSFNPIPFIRKSRLKITEVAMGDKTDADKEMNLVLFAKNFIRA